MVLKSMCSLWRDRSGGASVLRWRSTMDDSRMRSAVGLLLGEICNRQVTTCTGTLAGDAVSSGMLYVIDLCWRALLHGCHLACWEPTASRHVRSLLSRCLARCSAGMFDALAVRHADPGHHRCGILALIPWDAGGLSARSPALHTAASNASLQACGCCQLADLLQQQQRWDVIAIRSAGRTPPA